MCIRARILSKVDEWAAAAAAAAVTIILNDVNRSIDRDIGICHPQLSGDKTEMILDPVRDMQPENSYGLQILF
jgi:hypothetical protein